MRRGACLVIGAAVSLLAPVAAAQQGPPPAVAVPAPPAAASPVRPVAEDPPYNPAEHGYLAYSAWLRATRGTGRRSTGMMVTGIALATLGVTLLATGTGVYAGGAGCDMQPGPNGTLLCGAQAGLTTGLALMASGLIGLGIGLPLTFFGAAQVPRAEAGSAPPRASVAATVVAGPQGAALRLSF